VLCQLVLAVDGWLALEATAGVQAGRRRQLRGGGSTEVPPVNYFLCSAAVAAVLCYGATLCGGGASYRLEGRKGSGNPGLVLLCGALFCLRQVCFTLALEDLSVVHVNALQGISPVLVCVGTSLASLEKIPKLAWVSLVTAVAASVFCLEAVTPSATGTTQNSMSGAGFSLMLGVCFSDAVLLVLQKILSGIYRPLHLSAWTFSCAAALSIPYFFAIDHHLSHYWVRPRNLLAFAFHAIAGFALQQTAHTWAIRRTTATTAACLTTCQPVLFVALALLLDPSSTYMQVAGLGVAATVVTLGCVVFVSAVLDEEVLARRASKYLWVGKEDLDHGTFSSPSESSYHQDDQKPHLSAQDEDRLDEEFELLGGAEDAETAAGETGYATMATL